MPGPQSSTQLTQGEESTAKQPNQSNKNQNIKALSTLYFAFGLQYNTEINPLIAPNSGLGQKKI